MIALVGIGLIGGFLSGLFGVGGGFIIIPLLMAFFAFDIKKASATSLAAIAVTAVAGTVSYAASGGVLWLPAVALSVGSITGSYVGARLLKVVSARVILWIFVALVLVLAVRMMFSIDSGGIDTNTGLDWGNYLEMAGIGVFAGLLAGLLGVGGGIIVVPLLVIFFGFSSFEAKGTSLVMLIPASLVGGWVNLRNGFVDVKVGLSIGVIAGAVSFTGVIVAKTMPETVNNILFAILMLGIAAQFAVRAIRLTKPHRPIY